MLKANFKFREHSSPIYAMCQGALPHQLLSGSSDGFAVQWNFANQCQDPLVIKTEQAIWSNLYLPVPNVLILAVSNGDLHVIDVSTKKETRLLRLHSAGVSKMVFNAQTNEMYAAGADGVLSVWNTTVWNLIRAIPLSTARLRTIALHTETQQLAIAGQEGKVHILETTFFNEIHTLHTHDSGVSALAWHPTKSALISGGKDAHLKAWNSSRDFEEVASIPAHNFAIYDIVFSPNHETMATCSRDKSIKLWNANTLEPLQRLEIKEGGHSHSVNRLIWNETGLYSCSDDRSIMQWVNQ
jgi:WD40 repeat protein